MTTTGDATSTTRRGAFAGVRVLEDAALVAGPFCGKLLADLGADVVKLEPPSGDPARRIGPFSPGKSESDGGALFLYCNTNKCSITLDTSVRDGKDVLLRLFDRMDVVDTNAGTCYQGQDVDMSDCSSARLAGAEVRASHALVHSQHLRGRMRIYCYYLPPYGPMLNAIEAIFGVIQARRTSGAALHDLGESGRRNLHGLQPRRESHSAEMC
jgi:CoA-transferase family III